MMMIYTTNADENDDESDHAGEAAMDPPLPPSKDGDCAAETIARTTESSKPTATLRHLKGDDDALLSPSNENLNDKTELLSSSSKNYLCEEEEAETKRASTTTITMTSPLPLSPAPLQHASRRKRPLSELQQPQPLLDASSLDPPRPPFDDATTTLRPPLMLISPPPPPAWHPPRTYNENDEEQENTAIENGEHPMNLLQPPPEILSSRLVMAESETTHCTHCPTSSRNAGTTEADTTEDKGDGIRDETASFHDATSSSYTTTTTFDDL